MYFLNHHMLSVKSFAVLLEKKKILRKKNVSGLGGGGLRRGARIWKNIKGKITRNV